MNLTDPAVLWAIGGALLLVVELMTLTTVMACFGIAAIATSVVIALLGLQSLAAQLSIFALASLALLLGVRRFYPQAFRGRKVRRRPEPLDDSGLMGLTARVATPFVDGRGTITLNGVKWDAEADPGLALEPGEAVVVTGKRGITLQVAPASSAG